MQYRVTDENIDKTSADCIVVALCGKRFTPSAELLDKKSGGMLKKLLAQELHTAQAGSVILHQLPHIKARRVLVVDVKQTELNEHQFCKHIASVANTLLHTASQKIWCGLSDIKVKGRDDAWKINQILQAFETYQYAFDGLKQKKDPRPTLQQLSFPAHTQKEKRAFEKTLKQSTAIAEGIKLAKDLGNLPGNICTPTYLANEAKKLQKKFSKIKVSVLDEPAMKKLGMNALLAVSRGSQEPAKLITIKYQGGKNTQKPIVLVGKGITFDSGGISIKPSLAMDEMKFDMCGAASVIGTLYAIAQLKLPLNVIGMIAASENLPGGKATKPGDIVKSASGKTIEILNTDAEGRLVLCDALHYARRFNPKKIIDIATLTGAVIVGLGTFVSGLMSNSDQLAADLQHAGDFAWDRVWRLPLGEDYHETLESNFADMANISGGSGAGSITAGCFLEKFVDPKTEWAHLDIAGTAWLSGKAKGATGRPVSLLTHYLLHQAETDHS